MLAGQKIVPGVELVTRLLHLVDELVGLEAERWRRSFRRILTEVDDRDPSSRCQGLLELSEIRGATREVMVGVDDDQTSTGLGRFGLAPLACTVTMFGRCSPSARLRMCSSIDGSTSTA